MKKVFCIICHKMTGPLICTVNYLSSFDENLILIHVDAKSNIGDFEKLKSKNVIFLKDRVKVNWGQFSLLESTLLLLRESLNFDYEYLFLISGDDLPCKSNDYINQFLKEIGCKNMLHYQDERSNYVDPLSRVRYKYPAYFFSKKKRFLDYFRIRIFYQLKFLFVSKEFKRNEFRKIIFYKGGNWFSFNRKTVFDIISFIDDNQWYLSLFNDAYCGDEIFFQTLLKFMGNNDLYSDKSKRNDVLRYIDWSTGPDYPRTLNYDDIIAINNSSCLFARKFHESITEDFMKLLIQDL